ncbi:unnamed protein product (macronuclear) [Paramecium tetraurelia]|uniref:Uncharacterized protein n=1 Tax=Paramecium tetraurelia TaxID=5888 RepID=A0C713_PARTE|nr:uncharacterized protein GSPATT00035709001 [Paramecium tetraurelia]CAK66580.1 unnamed protein product [Paramecium tetraurelia]
MTKKWKLVEISLLKTNVCMHFDQNLIGVGYYEEDGQKWIMD